MRRRGMPRDVAHPILGSVTPPASPLGFHGAAAPELKLLPALGEHTGEVLGEWPGLGGAEIETLHQAGPAARAPGTRNDEVSPRRRKNRRGPTPRRAGVPRENIPPSASNRCGSCLPYDVPR